VLGSLGIKGGRRCHLLLNKRWRLLPSFLSNEPGTGWMARMGINGIVRVGGDGLDEGRKKGMKGD
jgi:hypothetical protein